MDFDVVKGTNFVQITYEGDWHRFARCRSDAKITDSIIEDMKEFVESWDADLLVGLNEAGWYYATNVPDP